MPFTRIQTHGNPTGGKEGPHREIQQLRHYTALYSGLPHAPAAPASRLLPNPPSLAPAAVPLTAVSPVKCWSRGSTCQKLPPAPCPTPSPSAPPHDPSSPAATLRSTSSRSPCHCASSAAGGASSLPAATAGSTGWAAESAGRVRRQSMPWQNTLLLLLQAPPCSLLVQPGIAGCLASSSPSPKLHPPTPHPPTPHGKQPPPHAPECAELHALQRGQPRQQRRRGRQLPAVLPQAQRGEPAQRCKDSRRRGALQPARERQRLEARQRGQRGQLRGPGRSRRSRAWALSSTLI